MKTHLDIKHTGTIDAEATRMTFDENAIAHLMSVLTDLYSDPVLAVIREYSTNAWDSHVAAGVTDPIEVFLPSEFNPVFVVRDNGLGMSLDALRDQFSKYGYSSKRDTDEQTGMLGLGCKSALSLTSQFTLVSRYNGLKIRVLITREADGCGSLKVIDTIPTDERNGVEVQIPGKPRDFASRVHNFFRFWEPGTVLVDGEAPKTVWEEDNTEVSIRLDPDVVVLVNTSKVRLAQSYIVMGNVAYPISSGKFPMGWSVVARVPIGSVNFTPSREALAYTKRTNETLDTVVKFVQENITRRVAGFIQTEPSMRDAYLKLKAWTSDLECFGINAWRYDQGDWRFDTVTDPNTGVTRDVRVVTREAGWRSRFTWKNSEIPKIVNLDESGKSFLLPAHVHDSDRDHAKRMDRDTIMIDDLLGFHGVVVGYKGNTISPTIKKKARALLIDKLGAKPSRHSFNSGILFVPHLTDHNILEFIDPAFVVDIETVRNFTPPNDTAEPEIKRHYFSLLVANGSAWWPARPYTGKPVAYIESIYRFRDGIARQLINTFGARKIACVPKAQMARFKRDHPDVPHVKELIETRLREVTDKLHAWSIYYSEPYKQAFLGGDRFAEIGDRIFSPDLSAKRIDDPEFRELLTGWQRHEKSGNNDNYDGKYNLLVRLASSFEIDVPPVRAVDIAPRLRQLVNRYPLMPHLRDQFNWSKQVNPAIYDYLNERYMIEKSQIHLHPATY